ncbi:helix-turn-helix domain-containing protein [Zavarzinia sp.]|uniref:helix-turn-helix domain-containing protein n=1 Tax=Zavarzinia sp. TaxID=2027920 RepID=UPI003BB6754D
MKARRTKKRLPNGRDASDQKFTKVMRCWLESPAWREAGTAARTVWLHLRMADPMGRNEPVNASVRKLAEETGLAPGTTHAALQDLFRLGFIERVTDGVFACQGGEKLAQTVRQSFEFLRWRPEKNASPVSKSDRDRIKNWHSTTEAEENRIKNCTGSTPVLTPDRIKNCNTSITMGGEEKPAGKQLRDTRTGRRVTEVGTPADPAQANLHSRCALVLASAGGGRRLAEAAGVSRNAISQFGRGERALTPDQVRRLEAGLAALEADPAPTERGEKNAA